jgi:aerobic-type carbon monoxide dehydrogenase small subunit (CoxS/CutS family)
MADEHEINVAVNGVTRAGRVDSRRTLADFLRDDLGLTGTHVGCEYGQCGACNVLVDGVTARSCLMFAVQANGHEILTVEGLDLGGELNPLQAAMRDTHAFQCGFCTPGFLMTATALLAENRGELDRIRIREELAGNLCRCSGYQSIVDGVELALARTLEQGEAQ